MNPNRLYPTSFTLGALLLFTVLFLVPSIMGVLFSFTDWNRFSDSTVFVGLANFKKVFLSDPQYLAFIKNTLVFAIASTAIKTLLALVLALLLTGGVRLRGFHRLVAFTPQVLSYLIVGLVFRGMLHPSTGFLNIALRGLGLEALTRDWLGDVHAAFGTILAVDAWKGVGYGMVIFIAGIQAIPPMYYEAAQIDGASYLQRVVGITLPFLIPTLMVNLVLSLTYGLRVFDIVYVLTNGGPGWATDVLNTVVFREFSRGNYAMGTTLSSLLAASALLLAWLVIRVMDRKMEYS